MNQGAAPSSDVEVGATLELLFRRRAGQLTSTLTRLFGMRYLDLVEDVVQDAFVQALRKWPSNGVPSDPGAWIVRVARNKAVDELRRQGRWEEKRREFDASFASLGKTENGPIGFSPAEVADDELRMIFAVCHPTIPRNAQVALTLKVVGGFSVDEIAHAFLAPKATIAQRIVRAKRSLRQANVSLVIPPGSELRGHLDSVLDVIYLMFNEGYSATAGETAVRAELCGEAIRLVELLADHRAVQEPRVEALAALFLFQASRLPARTGLNGEIVTLADQDRGLWDRAMIGRALRFLGRSARGDELTTYHIQAQIGSYHSLAPTFEKTPWQHILTCYDDLVDLEPTPVVRLNRAVALSKVEGAEAGLAAIHLLEGEKTLVSYPYLYAIKADLLARLGRFTEAESVIACAIGLVQSLPARLFLQRRLHRYRAAR